MSTKRKNTNYSITIFSIAPYVNLKFETYPYEKKVRLVVLTQTSFSENGSLYVINSNIGVQKAFRFRHSSSVPVIQLPLL